MTREEVVRFSDTVDRIKRSNGSLSQYFEPEIAVALQGLIDSAVETERQNCALVAESAAEPDGWLSPGEMIQVDQTKRKICLKIAQRIRERGAR